MLRLRKRRSLRGRMANAVDRSIGWVVVTIVGFLTAILAFVIVRLEQWLFDIKEGYCNDGWWKAKRFCCPVLGAEGAGPLVSPYPQLPFSINLSGETQMCGSWSTWSETFSPGSSKFPFEGWFIEYMTYTFFAVRC